LQPCGTADEIAAKLIEDVGDQHYPPNAQCSDAKFAEPLATNADEASTDPTR
jgi:hypothetical protein